MVLPLDEFYGAGVRGPYTFGYSNTKRWDIRVQEIVGDKEVENQAVSVRKRKEGDLGQLPVEAALDLLEEV